MRRITRRAGAITTRIRKCGVARLLAWSIAILVAGGCATPGTLHLYSISRANLTAVHDSGGHGARKAPSFIDANENLVGFAYDPFTDHFFLRLSPGDRIRVVDRPAQAVKREFKIEVAPARGGDDLTIKPGNGHVFLSIPLESRVLEITRLGKIVRVITLENSPAFVRGIAYDAGRDVLCVLHGNPATRITRYDLRGRETQSIVVSRELAGPLAFDSERREFYAPISAALGSSGRVGVFDEDGRLVRSLDLPADYIDVGPRSLVRVF
jgi:hypothetical protein